MLITNTYLYIVYRYVYNIYICIHMCMYICICHVHIIYICMYICVHVNQHMKNRNESAFGPRKVRKWTDGPQA